MEGHAPLTATGERVLVIREAAERNWLLNERKASSREEGIMDGTECTRCELKASLIVVSASVDAALFLLQIVLSVCYQC